RCRRARAGAPGPGLTAPNRLRSGPPQRGDAVLRASGNAIVADEPRETGHGDPGQTAGDRHRAPQFDHAEPASVIPMSLSTSPAAQPPIRGMGNRLSVTHYR